MINELSPESIGHIDYWVTKFPAGKKRSAIIASLQFLQEENNGHLSSDIIQALATYLNLPVIQIYEVATFYSMFQVKPVGKICLSVCTNVSCSLNGASAILAHLENRLGVKVSESTPDGKFFLKNEEECLAACCGAPMMMVDHDYHENLTIDKVDQLIDKLSKK
jgi:NADH-quinone oxidoreductase subunit E